MLCALSSLIDCFIDHRVQNAKQAYCDNYFKNTVNLTESNTNGDLSSMEDSGIVLDTDESDDEYQQNDDEEEVSKLYCYTGYSAIINIVIDSCQIIRIAICS